MVDPDAIRGVIEKVDPMAGLVQISIGSDGGLKKGDLLQVFRLQPEAKFLGDVRVEEVTPTRSVGRYLGGAASLPRVGDHVASKLAAK